MVLLWWYLISIIVPSVLQFIPPFSFTFFFFFSIVAPHSAHGEFGSVAFVGQAPAKWELGAHQAATTKHTPVPRSAPEPGPRGGVQQVLLELLEVVVAGRPLHDEPLPGLAVLEAKWDKIVGPSPMPNQRVGSGFGGGPGWGEFLNWHREVGVRGVEWI